jgi:hypothetical protein
MSFLLGTNIIYIYESRVISATGRGGPHISFLGATNIIYIKSEASPLTDRGGLYMYFL